MEVTERTRMVEMGQLPIQLSDTVPEIFQQSG